MFDEFGIRVDESSGSLSAKKEQRDSSASTYCNLYLQRASGEKSQTVKASLFNPSQLSFALSPSPFSSSPRLSTFLLNALYPQSQVQSWLPLRHLSCFTHLAPFPFFRFLFLPAFPRRLGKQVFCRVQQPQ